MTSIKRFCFVGVLHRLHNEAESSADLNLHPDLDLDLDSDLIAIAKICISKQSKSS